MKTLVILPGVECGDVVLDTSLSEGERAPRVAVVSRGVGGRAAFSCPPGFALRGAPETVCLPHANWAKPFPVCRGKSLRYLTTVHTNCYSEVTATGSFN